MAGNLEVELIYLYARENAAQHKTDKFELVLDEDLPTSVLRRGMKFTMAIRFAGREFIENIDVVRLIFSYGPDPNSIKGTKGIVNVTSDKITTNADSYWAASILAKGSDTLTVEVYCPANVPVGLWRLDVNTSRVNSTLLPNIFPYDNDIYILFNPWVCHDLVCMPDKRLLDEYILQDVGKIWVGPWGSAKGREWVFGQFNASVLPAIMLMIDRSNLPHASRGDPIKMVRMISKMVNSNDDDGVLIGRWDGDYSDGTAPAAWTGSAAILQEFLDTEAPVPYGQCWVFSGVVTTICRALGIPSRVISNLVSAHDANSTLTVDKYYNIDDEEIEGDPNNPMGEDSIWNYHVWNDVWMARPDLPIGYGGWQAIDATPQEKSRGVFQCGPASVEAIRKGEVGYNYDVTFLVASVNADIMRWKEDPNHTMGYSRVYCNKYHVGKLILTKKPFVFDPNGDRDREDITAIYKHKEGTEAERLSLYNAVRGTETAKKFFLMPDEELEDMQFDLEDLETINIGEDFKVVVIIKNKSNEVRHVSAILSATSIFYTGIKANLIDKAKGEFVMKPQTTEILKMTVKADKYLDKLVEYGMMKIYGVATVKETRQTWADEDDFQVIKPTIKIVAPSEIIVKTPTTITMSFVNPLNAAITNCKFYIHGPSLLKNYALAYPDARPHETLEIDTVIAPKTCGEQILVATFHSDQLNDITGSVKINVTG